MYDVQITAPQDGGSTIAIIYQFFGSGGYVDYSFLLMLPTLGQTQQDIYNAAIANMSSYAAAQGYSLTSNVTGWYPDVATASKPGVISSSTASFIAALAAQVQPQSYQAIVSQSGTSAPSILITPVNTYSGTPTFSWARTGTGVYTLTASSPVFSTSGKTGVLTSPPANPVANFKYVVTSSTVITFTSSVNALVSLLGLTIGATNTDAILSATMIYVQTYP